MCGHRQDIHKDAGDPLKTFYNDVEAPIRHTKKGVALSPPSE